MFRFSFRMKRKSLPFSLTLKGVSSTSNYLLIGSILQDFLMEKSSYFHQKKLFYWFAIWFIVPSIVWLSMLTTAFFRFPSVFDGLTCNKKNIWYLLYPLLKELLWLGIVHAYKVNLQILPPQKKIELLRIKQNKGSMETETSLNSRDLLHHSVDILLCHFFFDFKILLFSSKIYIYFLMHWLTKLYICMYSIFK